MLKGYATSASVILTGALSAALFDTTLGMHFVLAVVNVTCSIALYGSLASGAPKRADQVELEALVARRHGKEDGGV